MATFSSHKTIHFGQRGAKDFIQWSKESPLKAAKRRHSYLQRHAGQGERWDDPFTAGALSRWILWEKPTLENAIKAYKRRFGL